MDRPHAQTSSPRCLHFWMPSTPPARLLIVESLAAGDSALSRRRAAVERMIAFVDEANAELKAAKQTPSLTAEGVVGGVLSILHSRLLAGAPGSFLELTGPAGEHDRAPLPGIGGRPQGALQARPQGTGQAPSRRARPLGQLDMRLTYRTVRVLLAVAAQPGDSNRGIAAHAGIGDQGQISKLLARLEKLGLVVNKSTVPGTGAPNAWVLTKQGEAVHVALATRS